MYSSVETVFLCKMLRAIGPLFMEILHLKDLGDTSVISECSLGVLVLGGYQRMQFGCSSSRRVSNFNSKVPQGGIYPHIKFERDRLNIIRVRVFMSSGSTGGDAKSIISPLCSVI